MKVHWTEAALADLKAVEAYISRHSPRYARAMVERIFVRTDQLAQHSHSGSTVPEYEDDTLRELIEQPYRIVYTGSWNDKSTWWRLSTGLDECQIDLSDLLESRDLGVPRR